MIENINPVITGNIEAEIDGDISGNIITQLSDITGDIVSVMSVITGSVSSSTIPEIYDGDYIVIPKTVEQTLETKQKNMRDNVTVKEVPYEETSNKYGTTVSIVS